MLLRISLIVAILAALAAGTLNVLQVRGKINTLISQRDDYHSQLDQTKDTLAKTQKDLSKTKTDLAQTQQQLNEAIAARKKAEDTATAQQKRADDLTEKLAKTTTERDDYSAQLGAYTSTGLSAKEVSQLAKQLKDAQESIAVANEEKTVLTRTVVRLQNKLNEFIGTDYVVKLRSDLKGKVIVVDPKWDFVVLNIGEDQGVLQDGELLVSRDGKLVAKVVVRTVERNRSIANIVPGWKIGDVYEGDVVTPAHPAS
jgi:flagellar biosynthesis chaperone FliJ